MTMNSSNNNEQPRMSIITTIWRLIFVAAALVVTVTAMATGAGTATTTIRVCQGSGCLGKCRGGFNPLDSFQALSLLADAVTAEENTNTNVAIEEAYCMNQCKRGPNARIISPNRQVLVFVGENENSSQTIMNDTEQRRKAFQGLGSQARVEMVWGLAQGVATNDGNGQSGGVTSVIESGSVDKLTDMMPVSPPSAAE
jgi:NADH:ubiquinone oxidoreductase subunit E